MGTIVKNRIEYTLECLPEDASIVGNAIASGDAELDHETELAIAEELDSGNRWAWCLVRVTAKYDMLTGVAYLGLCSYASEAEFKADEYFQMLKDEALRSLVERIQEIRRTLGLSERVDVI